MIEVEGLSLAEIREDTGLTAAEGECALPPTRIVTTSVGCGRPQERTNATLDWLRSLLPDHLVSTLSEKKHSGMAKTFRDRVVVGLDIEWRPQFKAGMPENPISLIQICLLHVTAALTDKPVSSGSSGTASLTAAAGGGGGKV